MNFKDWLRSFLVRRARVRDIERILGREGFQYTDEDVQALVAGNQKGTRYGNQVLMRAEGGQVIPRFVKIMLDGRRKTFRLFLRQVRMAEALAQDPKYQAPTMQVITSRLRPPVPYAVFETRDNGDDFGFMDDDPVVYAGLDEQQIQEIVRVMYAFHHAATQVDPSVLAVAQRIPEKQSYYHKELRQNLERIIAHHTATGEVVVAPVATILERYLGITAVKKQILDEFDRQWRQIEQAEGGGPYLVHADMQIDNVYQHANGTFELIDFEWVGTTEFWPISIMYDYGNLRARAWSSPQFQQSLDAAMTAEGGHWYPGQEAIVQAACKLARLRSGVAMCRFHLDFENTVKKDRRTEAEYHAMYPATVAAIADVLGLEPSLT